MTVWLRVWDDRMTECTTAKEQMWSGFVIGCEVGGGYLNMSFRFGYNCMNQWTVSKERGRMLLGMLFREACRL